MAADPTLKQFVVRLPREHHQSLKEASEVEDVSMQEIVRAAVAEWLARRAAEQQIVNRLAGARVEGAGPGYASWTQPGEVVTARPLPKPAAGDCHHPVNRMVGSVCMACGEDLDL